MASNGYNLVQVDSENLIVLNLDELNTNNEANDLQTKVQTLEAEVRDLKNEFEILKKEKDSLKEELESSNKRNLLIQNYLVAVNDRVADSIFTEKDGGRLYRGGVFINKNQCAILDAAENDREFLNNLLVSIFGREVLKTHSLTGAPSNNTKGPRKRKLDEQLVQLIYDIMDARSLIKKTPPLTTSEKNAIIGKKISNVSNYKPKAKNSSN